jgi:hypothetical protein
LLIPTDIFANKISEACRSMIQSRQISMKQIIVVEGYGRQIDNRNFG